MSRYSYVDIVIELSELCRDIVSEVRHQLNYYRASVYKDETSRHINNKVEKLRLVAKLMHDEILIEAFRDHDAEKDIAPSMYMPGECSFSTRTARLLLSIEKHCDVLLLKANNRQLDEAYSELSRNIHRYRRELLSVCRHGSRQWAFFHTI